MLFAVEIKRDVSLNSVDPARVKDAVRRFAFLLGYVTRGYTDGKRSITLDAGSPLSLNPNTVKHTMTISYGVGNTIAVRARASALPWARRKISDIISYRLVQLLAHLEWEGLIDDEGVSEVEKNVSVAGRPFTHLAEPSVFCFVSTVIKIWLSMAACVAAVIVLMLFYGAIIIGIKDGRLFLEVTFGAISPEQLTAGASIVGIVIGGVTGLCLSIYFALSEVIEYMNKRIVSFAMFYAAVMCLFIIEEEAVIVTGAIAIALPFFAWVAYAFVWGLKKVFIMGADE